MHYISGVRPSGNLHLGNYLGAIKKARDLGATVFIADMHGKYTKSDVTHTHRDLERLGVANILVQSAFGASTPTYFQSYSTTLV